MGGVMLPFPYVFTLWYIIQQRDKLTYILFINYPIIIIFTGFCTEQVDLEVSPLTFIWEVLGLNPGRDNACPDRRFS
jgi:hypothetical protein